MEYGELLLDDASALGDVETLLVVAEHSGGEVYDRRTAFPPEAEPLMVEAMEGCGTVGTLHAMNWEQMRTAFSMLP